MRNIWLIVQREYLQRVRTRTFLVLTVLAPAIMTALMILPAKFVEMGEKAQHIVIVTSKPHLGDTVRQELLSNPIFDEDDENSDSSGSR